MILVDSNIFIDFWKQKDPSLESFFKNNEIAICGIIHSELIHGAKTDKEIAMINRAMDSLFHINVEESDWVEIGLFLRKMRESGLSLPFQDAVIAYLSIKSGFPIKTNDKHFRLMSVIDERIKLV